jgi:hypothetical protein
MTSLGSSSSSSSSSSGSSGGAGSSSGCGHSNSTQGGPTSSTDDTRSRLKMLEHTVAVWGNAQRGLCIYSSVLGLMGTAGRGGGAAAACLQPAPAALQLILTAYQTLSRVRQQLQPDGTRNMPQGLGLEPVITAVQGMCLRAAHKLCAKLMRNIRTSPSRRSTNLDENALHDKQRVLVVNILGSRGDTIHQKLRQFLKASCIAESLHCFCCSARPKGASCPKQQFHKPYAALTTQSSPGCTLPSRTPLGAAGCWGGGRGPSWGRRRAGGFAAGAAGLLQPWAAVLLELWGTVSGRTTVLRCVLWAACCGS